MNTNPFAPPAIPESEAPPVPMPRPPRPFGVFLLSGLHLLGGIGMLGMELYLLVFLGKLTRSLELVGFPLFILVGTTVFVSALLIASAIGMWRGARWGWRLGTFYYVLSICRNVLALTTAIMIAEELVATSRGPGYYFIKHSMRIAVHFAILLYFFRRNVLAYFGISEVKKIRTIAAHFGICLAIYVLAVVLSVMIHLATIGPVQPEITPSIRQPGGLRMWSIVP